MGSGRCGRRMWAGFGLTKFGSLLYSFFLYVGKRTAMFILRISKTIKFAYLDFRTCRFADCCPFGTYLWVSICV